MLPIRFPFPAMEALVADEIPEPPGWRYEPKWDGFRCLIFRDGDRIELQSKAGKSLARYFPDVVEAVRELGAKRFVLDGEIAVPVKGALSFDDLLQRIHPAASRVRTLAESHPALLLTPWPSPESGSARPAAGLMASSRSAATPGITPDCAMP